MSIKVEVPADLDPVRKEMEALAESLNKVLHCKIKVVPFYFQVESKGDKDILESILKYVSKEPEKRNGNGKNGMSRASYMQLSSGAVITTRDLHKRMAEKQSSLVNECFENHKGQRFVMIELDGKLELVKEPEE